MIEKAIGERIRELRVTKRFLNQEEFALKIGRNKAYLCRVEMGKQNLTIESLAVICKGLGVTLSEFFSTINHALESGQEENHEE